MGVAKLRGIAETWRLSQGPNADEAAPGARSRAVQATKAVKVGVIMINNAQTRDETFAKIQGWKEEVPRCPRFTYTYVEVWTPNSWHV